MSEPPPLPPPMATLAYEGQPPLVRRDEEHLRLLSLFHYIGGGIVMAVSLIPIIHIVIGVLLLVNPGAIGSPSSPDAPFAGTMLVVMGSAFVLIGETLGGLVIYSGRCIARRRFRMFSLVMAGVMCLQVPLGTVLGVFTFVVLLRDSVKEMYNAMQPAPGRL